MSVTSVLSRKAPSDSYVLQRLETLLSRHKTPSLDGAQAPSDHSNARPLDGPALERLVRVMTLLASIDPVRGEPTVSSLDSHPHDLRKTRESRMVKFIDSFAWISSDAEKSGLSAAAVCLEESPVTGTTLRLCRNNGVLSQLANDLQGVLDNLSLISSGAASAHEKETEILLGVITICRRRIRSLFQKLQGDKVQAAIKSSIESRDAEDTDSAASPRDNGFENWLQLLSALLELDLDAPRRVYARFVKWASEARWTYTQQIEDTFFPDSDNPPWWVYAIYKIGRYFTAVQSMVRFAKREQNLFASIQVKAGPATEPSQPRVTKSSNVQDQLTMAIDQCKLGSPSGEIIEQLGTLWRTERPHQHFERAVTKDGATVHAEMQLLCFYDHHPELRPKFLFMGTSKKACFLCHEVITRHYLGMKTYASHQKIYPSWTPSPCSDARVRKLYKELLWELTRHMEGLAGSDVRTRLQLGPRGRNLDSTAGLSSITESI